MHRPYALSSVLVLGPIVVVAGPCLAGGEIVTWDAAAPGVWSVPFNWSGNAVPTPADAVLITSGSTITVDVNPTIEAFTLASAATTMVCNGRTVNVLISNPLSCCSKVLDGQLDLTSSTWICPTAFQVQGLVRVANSNFDVGEIAILPGGEMRTIGNQGIDSPFTISPGLEEGLLAVSPGTWVRFDPGAKHPNGTIQQYGRVRVDNTALVYFNGSHDIVGGGTLQLVGPNTIVAGWAGGETVVFEIFVEGAGTLGNNSLNFETEPTFTVVANGRAPLSIDPAASFVNRSALVAASGSTLRLQPATFDSSWFGAEIRAEDGGVVELNACLLYDGSLVTEGSGRIRVVGNTTSLQGIHTDSGLDIAGILEIPNGLAPRFVDTLHNTGEIRLLGSGASTIFYVDNANTNGVRLSGGGELALSDSPTNVVAAWNGGETLTNVDNLIHGAGSLGNNSVNFVNQAAGRIEADATNILALDPAATLINAGALRAVAGGTLRLQPATFDGSAATSVIEALAGSTVELNAATIIGGRLRSEASGRVRVIGNTTTLQAPSDGQPLTIEGILEVPNGIAPRLIDGIVNTGEIRLLSSGANTILYVDNSATGGVQLTGGGTVSMSSSSGNIVAAWNGGETLTNVDNLIRGGGSLGNNSLNLVNEVGGRIEADVAAILLIDPAATLTNGGVIAARDGATLRLQPALFDQPTETGVIEAREGSVVELNGAALYRGLLRGVGTGVVRTISTASLQGDGAAAPLAIEGAVEIPNGTSIRLIDNIKNKGDIRLLSTGSNAILYVDNAASAGVQLTGGGTVSLGGVAPNLVTAWNGGETLTNVDNVIRGGGSLGNNSIQLVNQGTILADHASPLVVDVAAGSWTNSGALHVAAGSLLRSQDAVVMTGGEIAADGEFEVVPNVVAMSGGAVRGAGRVDSNLTMTGGVINPGSTFGDSSTGRLTIEGNVGMGAAAGLVADLGGYVPGVSYDVLDVDGSITLDGTLTISFAGGFEPFVGTSFTIVAADSVVGSFDQVVGPGTFSVLYRAHTVTVVVTSVTPPCVLGDLNCDGDVNGADLGKLLGAWGTCADCESCNADLDGDCQVSGSDLAILLGAWQ